MVDVKHILRSASMRASCNFDFKFVFVSSKRRRLKEILFLSFSTLSRLLFM